MKDQNHRAQYREAPEPEEGTRAIPKAVMALITILIVWGVGYYAWQIGKPLQGGDSRTAVASTSQQSKSESGSSSGNMGDTDTSGSDSSAAGKASPDGAAIYSARCSACHQANGQGVPGAFPPLAASEWVLASSAIPVAIVHDGLKGQIEVAGSQYQGVMPSFGGQLSDEELAAVLSYIRNQWGNDASEINPATIGEHKERFGDRKEWSAQELTEVFGEP